jgi:hypothetical protein
MGFTKVKAAGIATGLLIAGEILFYLSLALLGRSFYSKIKNKLRFRRRKGETQDKRENEQKHSENP